MSGAGMAGNLGMTRAAVHKRIKKLRDQGYRISGTTRQGYRLEAMPDRLEAPVLSAGAVLGRPFMNFPTAGSTQDEAKQRALQGAPEGLLVAAERQTAGRGRLGRVWISSSGGLWCSLVLRPALRPDQVPALGLVAALDWARAIRDRTGLAARVKWPNDVWVQGRKVAGLLIEMSSETDRVHWIVLGMGVNVNNAPPRDLPVPAASLAGITGAPVSRGALLSRWLRLFSRSYRLYQRRGFASFRQAYLRFSLLEGRTVAVDGPEGIARGRVAGVDPQGRLMVVGSKGTSVFAVGEVSLRLGRNDA